MATEVKTHSKCDRCGTTDTRDGAEGATPPVGWSSLSMTTRLDGPGWSNNRRPLGTHSVDLCPSCADRVAAYVLTNGG